MRLVDLSAVTGLHKATTRRLMAALVAEGMVEQVDQGYALGLQAWLIGRTAAKRFDLLPLAQGALRRIARESGDVALLCIASGWESRCIGREEGDHPILPTSVKVGTVRPLGCTSHGLAMLAALSNDEIDQAIVATARARASDFPSITDDVLRRRIARVQQDGVALVEGDIIAGQTALSVVIRDPWQRPVAALTCVAISERLNPERRVAIAALLRREAADVEARLRPP